MFETLSDRLTAVFQRIGNKGRLTEQDVDEAMREVRRALLEADVNYKVVRDFVSAVRERAVGEEVLKALTPAQQVISIVRDELIKILGEERVPLQLAQVPPTIVMVVGLQGSGKTTHVAKIANLLKKEGRRPLMVAADVYRPAAIDQLQTLGGQIDVPVYSEGTKANPVDIAKNAVKLARDRGYTVVLIDTAGRLQIDEPMMQEVERIAEAVKPHEILLVADAMTGQEAVNVAQEFHRRLALTGLVLTKMDGDARGGAALSIRSVVGVPIKYIGTGERIDAVEPFYPDRLASRILGMGDVLTLIERAQAEITEEESRALEEKVLAGQFNFEDFLNQLQQIKRMGPLTQLLEMIPGIGQALRQQQVQISDDEFKHIEAMIFSMTPEERRNPDILKPSRRKRIAAGSGTSVAQVNQLVNQFKQMQKMMAQFGELAGGTGGRRGLRGLMRSRQALAGLGDADLEALMQQGAFPPGMGNPALGGPVPRKATNSPKKGKSKKKKSKGRRR
ncbi:signal recognition particle protein [Sphaerobacter thermophilus]|uniref:Signal recognition particle protein n=1 Tax=Sphaerobacter thermophilus (strain ATCC 49802 / DSM 20745 / KCCM 41009 / NCIMB 13125 / S 6022) TaxID=479434 RepID=D1C722_SPHTD|nr:signal recognition particle protein [Sphaerobacter thermophilus]ACZ37783.1 signal recognition particle protein [Sphaerobacter thermophilus DSM 20745]